jgi:hypothetical protein
MPAFAGEAASGTSDRVAREPNPLRGPTFTAQFTPSAAPNLPGPNVPKPNVPPPNPGPNPPPTATQTEAQAQPIPPQIQPSVIVPVPVNPVPVNPIPGQIVPVPAGPPAAAVPAPVPPVGHPAADDSPLLDGKLPAEELLPPVVSEGGNERGVKPYGGGHPTDWSWGCGGSPYRTGPGMCDNWKVGCRWHVTVDGLVMHRENTDLVALAGAMNAMDPRGTVADPLGMPSPGLDPALTQFGYGPGGRITFTSQVSRYSCYDIQAVYEGINDWEASIVFPKQAILVVPDANNAVAGTQFVIPPSPNTEPPQPFPEGFQQRSLHYRSALNSGELNFLRECCSCGPEWRPFCGVRFIRFDDEINDTLNQEAQIPLPGPQTTFLIPGTTTTTTTTTGGTTTVTTSTSAPSSPFNDAIGPTSETDRFNIYHIQNNLMGFQIGLLHDDIRLNDRFAFEGVVNAGVYYNRVKYSNVMGVFTTQTFADNTRTLASSTGNADESRTDQSNVVNNDVRTISEISYEAEASLTAVCRLNKCWALRSGYQVLWMNHIHTADAAYIGGGDFSQDLLFHGWHAGIECRR